MSRKLQTVLELLVPVRVPVEFVLEDEADDPWLVLRDWWYGRTLGVAYDSHGPVKRVGRSEVDGLQSLDEALHEAIEEQLKCPAGSGSLRIVSVGTAEEG